MGTKEGTKGRKGKEGSRFSKSPHTGGESTVVSTDTALAEGNGAGNQNKKQKNKVVPVTSGYVGRFYLLRH